VAGREVYLFDNLTGTVGNAAIAAALTTTPWLDRILTTNTEYSGPLRTVWYATGNNIDWAEDVARRVLPIRLLTDMERPEERPASDFKHERLVEYIQANRPKLLSAALIVLRGWVVAGRPTRKLASWGSYEAWSDVVRQSIVCAGQCDPVGAKPKSADETVVNMTLVLIGVEQLIEELHMGSVYTNQVEERLDPQPSPVWGRWGPHDHS
jgi:hypothetical protein